jgi:hypothetical protein
LGCGKKTGKLADAAGPGSGDGPDRLFTIVTLPKIDPMRIQNGCQITNLQCSHSACVHGEQPAFQIQNLETIRTAFDQARSKIGVVRWHGISLFGCRVHF